MGCASYRKHLESTGWIIPVILQHRKRKTPLLNACTLLHPLGLILCFHLPESTFQKQHNKMQTSCIYLVYIQFPDGVQKYGEMPLLCLSPIQLHSIKWEKIQANSTGCASQSFQQACLEDMSWDGNFVLTWAGTAAHTTWECRESPEKTQVPLARIIFPATHCWIQTPQIMP